MIIALHKHDTVITHIVIIVSFSELRGVKGLLPVKNGILFKEVVYLNLICREL